MGSRLDYVYRSIAITKFFTKVWGKPENLRRLFEFRKVVSNRDRCFKLIERDYPVTITKEERTAEYRILEGQFASPLERFLPGIVPPAAQTAHFQMVLPLQWREPSYRPVCLHLAGTGDHFYWRRRNLMVKPLLKEACIGGIILENPFYGLRKPADQVRSALHNVSDIFVMGGCLILESLVLFHFCERNQLGPLGVTGLSMGGHMASLAATNWPKPMVLVPCLSWSTASAVFLQGVMSQSINWDLLEDQYLADGEYRKSLSKMVTVVDEAFLAGKKFARQFQKKVDQSPHEKKIIVDQLCDTEQGDGFCSEKTKDLTSDCSNDAKHFSGDTLASDLLLDMCDKSLVFAGNLRDKQELYEELIKLLNRRKISMGLFKKLTSNQRFSLSKPEIDQLNRINKEYVIRQIATKYKLDMTNAELALKLGLPPNCDRSAEGAHAGSHSVPPSRSLCNPVPLTKDGDEKKTKNLSEKTSDYFLGFPFIKNLLEDPKSGTDKTVAKQEKVASVVDPAEVAERGGGRPRLDISKVHWRDRETLQFMRGIMDEFTHLSNFSVPYDTSLIIAVCAKHDAYVPREDVGALEEIWPGAEVRYVDAGHVSAYILHNGLFRSSIVESFERSKKKWKNGKHIS